MLQPYEGRDYHLPYFQHYTRHTPFRTRRFASAWLRRCRGHAGLEVGFIAVGGVSLG